MLECAGDVCLYTLVVCSELLFAVAFSTRCNCCDFVSFNSTCCDSYFVSFNSTLLDTVKQDFNKLKDGFANIGLELSLEKCKLFMPGGTEVECQQHAAELGVTAIKPDEGLVVLGVPVGDDAWVEAELARTLARLTTLKRS